MLALFSKLFTDKSMFVFVCLINSLRLIKKLSVIKGRVFLGVPSTKLGLMFLLNDITQ